ncbi:hypothetical protein GJ496_011846 [Pomphorhynchus laevis]|nr:hypothetical protein GJ496_011846 [Pomphorhynchus laevis]
MTVMQNCPTTHEIQLLKQVFEWRLVWYTLYSDTYLEQQASRCDTVRSRIQSNTKIHDSVSIIPAFRPYAVSSIAYIYDSSKLEFEILESPERAFGKITLRVKVLSNVYYLLTPITKNSKLEKCIVLNDKENQINYFLTEESNFIQFISFKHPLQPGDYSITFIFNVAGIEYNSSHHIHLVTLKNMFLPLSLPLMVEQIEVVFKFTRITNAVAIRTITNRMTLALCVNVERNCKLKSLLVYNYENPRAFKAHIINKDLLQVY